MREGDHDGAFDAFTRSIAADPSLADPWANRATIAVKRGELDAALADLTQALALREDVVIFCNRAKVFERQQHWHGALDDYARALALGNGDNDAIDRGRERCLSALREAPARRSARVS
jgi:tetratricopeptide (TPR) repeat protein